MNVRTGPQSNIQLYSTRLHTNKLFNAYQLSILQFKLSTKPMNKQKFIGNNTKGFKLFDQYLLII